MKREVLMQQLKACIQFLATRFHVQGQTKLSRFNPRRIIHIMAVEIWIQRTKFNPPPPPPPPKKKNNNRVDLVPEENSHRSFSIREKDRGLIHSFCIMHLS